MCIHHTHFHVFENLYDFHFLHGTISNYLQQTAQADLFNLMKVNGEHLDSREMTA